MNILFTNAGRRTYMIDFALALSKPERPVSVFVGDYLSEAPAKHTSSETISITIPRVDLGEDAFAEAVLFNAKKYSIDLVIPLSDFELMPLARHKEAFNDAGIRLMVSNPGVIANTINKKNAYYFCLEHDIPTPRSMFERQKFDGYFPTVIKPILGSASIDMRVAETDKELETFREGTDMIQQCVNGDEYGVDILNDYEGNFITATVKRKILMRAGETDRAKVVRIPSIEKLAARISSVFRHIGNLDVDIIIDDTGTPFCIDFNARFGGGYPTTHLAGMDYLAALIGLAEGRSYTFQDAPREIMVVKGISLHVVEPEQ